VLHDLPLETLIDGFICRGARAMLGLSQNELCGLAKCGRKLLNDFENDIRVPSEEKRRQIRRALEEAGEKFYVFDIEILIGLRPGAGAGKSPRAKGYAPGG
jgi:transcriptional regulator with XRE-family HTH domain